MKGKQPAAPINVRAMSPGHSKNIKVTFTGGKNSYFRLHAQTNDVLLFLLDLTRITGDPGFLRLAKDIADRLAGHWQRFTCEARPRFTDIALKNDLSNSAFALAEAWKTTRDPIYRQTGLEIICFVDEMELTME